MVNFLSFKIPISATNAYFFKFAYHQRLINVRKYNNNYHCIIMAAYTTKKLATKFLMIIAHVRGIKIVGFMFDIFTNRTIYTIYIYTVMIYGQWLLY